MAPVKVSERKFSPCEDMCVDSPVFGGVKLGTEERQDESPIEATGNDDCDSLFFPLPLSLARKPEKVKQNSSQRGEPLEKYSISWHVSEKRAAGQPRKAAHIVALKMRKEKQSQFWMALPAGFGRTRRTKTFEVLLPIPETCVRSISTVHEGTVSWYCSIWGR